MRPLTRVASRSAGRLRQPLQQQQRRQASHSHEPEPQQHTTAAPKNESFGSGFFVGILCIPAAIGLYTVSRPAADGSEPYFTKFITERYAHYLKQNTDRNDLHVRALEQAAADRVLFLNDGGQRNLHVTHRFPESMNSSSPFLVPAGHGTANIDAMIAKYEQQAFAEQEMRHQRLRDNKVPCEQPLQ